MAERMEESRYVRSVGQIQVPEPCQGHSYHQQEQIGAQQCAADGDRDAWLRSLEQTHAMHADKRKAAPVPVYGESDEAP